MTLVLALAAGGCGARGDGGLILPVADVPPTTDVGIAVMDSGVGPADVGAPEDRGTATVTDDGTRRDAGAPADTAGCVATGGENTVAECRDGVDNDCDGFNDCTDPGCDPICSPPVDAGCVRTGDEGTNGLCSDGIDNDCDSYVDCVDFSCSMSSAVTICPRDAGVADNGCVATGAENTNTRCGDGVDNDCDGFFDCTDFDCQRSPVTICPRDGGTATDRPACDSGGALENTAAACGDGLDNDCDGFIDCSDNNCSCQGLCPPGRNAPAGCTCRGSENNTSACADGVDNDCNGFRDCADFGCSMNPIVTFCRDGG